MDFTLEDFTLAIDMLHGEVRTSSASFSCKILPKFWLKIFSFLGTDWCCAKTINTTKTNNTSFESPNIELPDSEIKMGVASSGGLPQPPGVRLSFEGDYLSRVTIYCVITVFCSSINSVAFSMSCFLQLLRVNANLISSFLAVDKSTFFSKRWVLSQC